MPLYRTLPTRPVPVAGQYFYTVSPGSSSTSGALGNGTLRVAPWLVDAPLTLSRVGAEVATVGEAGSRFRIGIYADNGSSYPGALVLDAGQINGDSATVQEITVSLTLAAGLYWIGGAVQSAATTQPTMRCASNWTPPAPLVTGTSIPSANGTTIGYAAGSQTGALASTFTATVSASGSTPRIFVRA